MVFDHYFTIIRKEQMSNISTATYIKKLVKMVYEKEKQIQSLKRELKTQCVGIPCQRQRKVLKEQKNSMVEDHLKTEVLQASVQLKEVHDMMNTMQQKIADLELGLQEETIKNQEYQQELTLLRTQNAKLRDNQRKMAEERRGLRQENSHLNQLLQGMKKDYSECTIKCAFLQQEMQEIKKDEEILKSEKHGLIVEIENIREQKSSIAKIQSQKESLLHIKKEMSQKISDYKLRQYEAQKKIRELTEQNERNLLQVEIIKHQLDNHNEILKKRQSELEQKKSQLEMKSNEYNLLNEKLKDYEEFAFEISQYIQSSFVKHCSQGTRSTKRLIKDGQPSNRFQYIFKKMTVVQNWMDSASERLEKLTQQLEIPNQTLDNLSHIMNSFEDKLKLCDLSSQLQLQKEEMIKNQEELIKNLQKQCEKSEEHERTKLVQLGEVKEVLKMTKDVNRQLMDEINRKQYIISECKKAYQVLIGNRSSNEYKNLKVLLDIKV